MSENSIDRADRKVREGLVVSDKMDKTVVVQINTLVKHATYGKYVRRRVKYKAHDERSEAHVGDTVIIEECRPISKEKRWRLKEITARAEAV